MAKVIVAMTLVCVGAGCATSSHPSADRFAPAKLTPPAIGSASPTAGSAQPRTATLPLDAYVDQSQQNGNLLIEVNGLLTKKCMAAKGFSFTFNQPSANASDQPANQPAVYGITDPAAAKRYGYGTAPATKPGAKAAPVQSLTQQIAQHGLTWVIALYGANYDGSHPSGASGCVDSATDPLYQSAYGNIDRSIVGELGADATSRAEADLRVVKVFRQWSSCMAAKGFNYPSPMQPAQVPWPATPSASEIATATADVACKQATNLAAVFSTIEAGYQQQLINQNRAALEAFQQGYQKLITLSHQTVARLAPH